MKIIEVEGMKYKVPDWVNWTAQDADGKWYAYEEKPNIVHRGNWWKPKEGRATYLFRSDESAGWAETLKRTL